MNFKTLQSTLFLSLLFFSTILFLWLIGSYLMPVFWALVLTIVFYPLYKKFVSYTKGRTSLASFLTILIMLITVLVPIYILGGLIINEAITLYLNLTQGGNMPVVDIVSKFQTLLSPLERFGINTTSLHAQIIALTQKSVAQIGLYTIAIGKFTIQTLMDIFIMMYIMFFTLRDGEKMGARIIHAFPLGNDKERMLFDRLIKLVQAMFKGTFIIAIIQGLIGAILFFVVGIQSAFLWAFVMSIFALVPAIGPVVVWVPIGVILILSGAVWQGVVVLLVGAIIISSVDNFLRPALVAKGAAMSDLLIFISIIGGLTLFGMAGIIIGPIITALFLTMWQIFENDYKKDLKKFG